ncbi:MAG TPA: CpaF family protein [Gaiellales bacterium]|nr:CpaF family protein [Gaiellales bacterium]
MTDSAAGLAAGYRERLRRELLDRPSGGDLRVAAERVAWELIHGDRVALDPADARRLVAGIVDDTVGLGPLDPLLRDRGVTEVIANGPGRIYAERSGRLVRETVEFRDEEHLRQVIDRVVSSVGRRVDESSPMVDARLPDGSRVNAVLPPIALDGPLLTIRKFARAPFRVDDLVAAGSLTPAQADLLERCVRCRLNVVVSGGTGTGKTTLLNALAGFIDPAERIVTVEDAAELRLPQPHVARLESRPPNVEGRGEVTLRALVRNALRMRPDRIVVGEVRGGEALDMLQAMNTGHDGSLTTVHASSPADAVRRIETMALMAGLDLPHVAVREQVASAVDVIVHLVRDGDGSRRVRFVDARGRDGQLHMLDSRLLGELEERRCAYAGP